MLHNYSAPVGLWQVAGIPLLHPQQPHRIPGQRDHDAVARELLRIQARCGLRVFLRTRLGQQHGQCQRLQRVGKRLRAHDAARLAGILVEIREQRVGRAGAAVQRRGAAPALQADGGLAPVGEAIGLERAERRERGDELERLRARRPGGLSGYARRDFNPL